MLDVDVVVVAYNSRQCLRRCVEPLAGAPGVSVLVVDNACPERSFEVVEDLPGVRVIHMDRNGGFAYGCNGGWRTGHSELVLFLNPDARIETAALARLADVIGSDPEAGVVGPRTLRPDGSLAWSIRRFPSMRTTYARAFFLHRLAPRASWVDEVVRDPAAYDRRGPVDWLPGTCLLVRRSTLEAVGGFDEGFFMYVEDLDLCWRVRQTGLEVVYSPEAVCVHEGGRSLPRAQLLPTLAASRLRYARQHGGAVGTTVQRLGIGIDEGLRTMIGRGDHGHRRGHLEALGVVLRRDGATGPDARHDGVRGHFLTHWVVWALLAVLAIVGNQVFDEMVREEHVTADDFMLAMLLVATAFVASYVVARRHQRPQT